MTARKNPPKDMSFGSKEFQEFHGLRHGSKASGDRKKRALAAYKKEAQEQAQHSREAATEKRRDAKTLASILGPSGEAYAMKVASQGAPFTRHAVDQFIGQGWTVYPAGSTSAKVGKPLGGWIENPSDDDFYRILGPLGKARAVIVATDHPSITEATVRQWRSLGYDVGAAPRKLRDGGIRTNPDGSRMKAEAVQKAREWFGRDDLVTRPERIPWKAPKFAVEIGVLVAIEYASNKWTGEETVYRHEFEEIRSMAISPDGSTIVVYPPFRITDRGIEG